VAGPVTATAVWDAAAWPRPGSCGACGRPAHEVPSGRWWHDGRPCRARGQTLWSVDDVHVKLAVRFVAESEILPAEPAKWHLHPETTGEHGIPTSFGICNLDHAHTVRDFLAREAEEGAR
jgi:hypothetical protein